MTEQRRIDPNEDPVCAMRVDLVKDPAKGRVLARGDVAYWFCSEGCLTQFRDDPAWFLDPAYTPTRM